MLFLGLIFCVLCTFVHRNVALAVESDNDFLLLANFSQISRFSLKTRAFESLPVVPSSFIVAVDYDLASNCVFWADNGLREIRRQCLADGRRSVVLHKKYASGVPYGKILFDWTTNVLYFVNWMESKIQAIDTIFDIESNGYRVTTIIDELGSLGVGLAIHPQLRYLFWTTDSENDGMIWRSHLNGTDARVLLSGADIRLPSRLSIDFQTNQLYWTDYLGELIGQCNLDGIDVHIIRNDRQFLKDPLVISVFEGRIFWSDSSHKELFEANLTTLLSLRTPSMTLARNVSYGDIRYISSSIQTESYYDTKSRKLSCSKTSRRVPEWLRCDGNKDCDDESDEKDCKPCPMHNFVCKSDGRCVPEWDQ